MCSPHGLTDLSVSRRRIESTPFPDPNSAEPGEWAGRDTGGQREDSLNSHDSHASQPVYLTKETPASRLGSSHGARGPFLGSLPSKSPYSTCVTEASVFQYSETFRTSVTRGLERSAQNVAQSLALMILTCLMNDLPTWAFRTSGLCYGCFTWLPNLQWHCRHLTQLYSRQQPAIFVVAAGSS